MNVSGLQVGRIYTHVHKEQSRTRLVEDAILEQRKALPRVFHHLLDIRIPEFERQDLRETVHPKTVSHATNTHSQPVTTAKSRLTQTDTPYGSLSPTTRDQTCDGTRPPAPPRPPVSPGAYARSAWRSTLRRSHPTPPLSPAPPTPAARSSPARCSTAYPGSSDHCGRRGSRPYRGSPPRWTPSRARYDGSRS